MPNNSLVGDLIPTEIEVVHAFDKTTAIYLGLAIAAAGAFALVIYAAMKKLLNI